MTATYSQADCISVKDGEFSKVHCAGRYIGKYKTPHSDYPDMYICLIPTEVFAGLYPNESSCYMELLRYGGFIPEMDGPSLYINETVLTGNRSQYYSSPIKWSRPVHIPEKLAGFGNVYCPYYMKLHDSEVPVLLDWCKKNLSKPVEFVGSTIGISDDADATLFLLTWQDSYVAAP